MEKPPMPEGEWRTIKVIFRANENIVQFHGAEEEVKTLEHNFAIKSGKVVKVGRDLIDTAEIAAIKR